MSQSGEVPLRVGTGMSTSPDAFEAGRAAATAALEPLEGLKPSVVMAFATPRYDLPALLAGIRSVTGNALLVGGTGSGEIVAGQYLGFGGGVGVMALAGGPYRFAAASRAHISGDLDIVGQSLARSARDAAGSSPYAAAMLITDSLLGDLQQFVQGVYRVTGPKVALVGGAAGDEQRFVKSSIFHDDAVHNMGALVVWIASERPLRVLTGHGWTPVGPPMLVTRAHGTKIEGLGGRPAAAAYEEQLGVSLEPSQFWGTSIWHPFGLMQPDGSHVIRVARMKNDDSTLTIMGCVPPVGSAVQVMQGSVDGLLAVDDDVVATILREQPDTKVILTFSCAARANILKDRAAEEACRLQAAAGETVTFGFYCCAEFARTSGTLATHNATLTTIAL